ncbi:unnamed protein product [Adineta steineri]|uniref:Ubiquitin-like domain-containing protein n=1 Tax=Adineta steineri TaxID=433720 RepID=A0A815C1I3_9BILA|nr:unnamed protein product [Adineta steineri]CAF1561169.1 unnamed protein product [Adineta steineri]
MIIHVFLDMALVNGTVPVKMVRIQSSDKPKPISHNTDVTVGLLEDRDDNIVYLRITVNQKSILSEELDHYKWIENSSTDGVAALDSSSTKIIIIYNATDKQSRDLFANMKRLLERESPIRPISRPVDDFKLPTEPVPRPIDPIMPPEKAVNDLINYVESGAENDTEDPARYLAKNRTNIQFNLKDPNDNKKKAAVKKFETQESSNILKLKLQIECHLDRNPLILQLDVRSGTNLRTLKDQIENKTGIKYKDQYWYAFERYMISDDYVFGSTQLVVPPPPRNAPSKRTVQPTEPIRTGDTLIMYIAQLRPYEN